VPRLFDPAPSRRRSLLSRRRISLRREHPAEVPMKLHRPARFVTAALLLVTGGPLSIHAASAPAGQTQWSKTVAAASKEGQVNVYMYAAWGNAIEEANVFQK